MYVCRYILDSLYLRLVYEREIERINAYVCVCMYVCMYDCLQKSTADTTCNGWSTGKLHVCYFTVHVCVNALNSLYLLSGVCECMYVYMRECVCNCMYVCMYVCMYDC